MSDILCVTNRRLCREDFLSRMEEIGKARPLGVILREKDLSGEEYQKLAAKTEAVLKKYGVPCIFHNFYDVAARQNASAVHLSLPVLRNLTDLKKSRFSVIGASCHSLEEAQEAEELGCAYITAGHIFETDCKKGLPGKGLEFLKNICANVSIPVYAIGGINKNNIRFVRAAGAKGACIMSSLMQCADAAAYLKSFRKDSENNAF